MNSKMQIPAQWLATIARVAIGALFIYMGASKALDPVGFLKLLLQYKLPFEDWLPNVVAAVLPWFEVFCGLLLALGIAVRGTSLISIGMLVPFTIVAAMRAAEIANIEHLAYCAVKFDCGCGAGEVFICAKIAENLLIIAASMLLLYGWGRPFSLRYHLLPTANGEPDASASSGG